MIRDPSDGSVREEISPDANRINVLPAKTLSEEISGLPAGSQRANHIARLEWSRDWMKTYHSRKAASHARGSNGEELQTAGDSGDGQGGA